MRFAPAVLLSAVVLVQPASAQDAPVATQATTQAAVKAAESWLALADAGAYADSWRQGAALFRAAVTEQGWDQALRAARAPYGAVKARVLVAAQYTRKLPGAPEGDYVVIQYRTEFAAKPGVETVTPMREADGSWKVSGYYIR